MPLSMNNAALKYTTHELIAGCHSLSPPALTHVSAKTHKYDPANLADFPAIFAGVRVQSD